MDAAAIEDILREQLDLTEVYVNGENAHFSVTAVSDEFALMSKVKQQQLIYAPLMQYIATNEIHALSIKTFTVEKWRKARLLNGL
ncbi:BolA family protein [Testudinibacter aquarius]|uniref:Acid stress-induced BolA-like protein IbaG/YrbA n=1 Tax=Testudinibacter aquarius TaxID=1524974 RepID=A0A4R3Y1H7_9PAST|nr:BolA family protein [Testudinibacter aquarius]TNG94521.1 BolA family transcriptional regulator [Pasteurellaceae bacterium USgator41]TNG95628.1 BolA family transcriptional regulator [Pasteurellaceae bacterium UScroc12]TNH00613.1 BolA family transcriptional regulator [Pasteurellaceae bacterium USgator11]TNH01178.1 BolA family transcriptional regulator [Pasteurellaceae bacterium UScroc31]KAE9525351.1 BolA family transcriptional regulator [Testudinibacter aquarius]